LKGLNQAVLRVGVVIHGCPIDPFGAGDFQDCLTAMVRGPVAIFVSVKLAQASRQSSRTTNVGHLEQ
jgi:hypothetical protein